MKVRFQFTTGSTEDSRRALVSELVAKGARGVGPLFSGEQDPELAALQVLNAGDKEVEHLIQHLKSSDCVQFAERELVRKIARPPAVTGRK